MKSRKVVIRNGKLVYDTNAVVLKPNETAANENRRNMKDKWRKEMLQKNQVGYYKQYPKQAENLSDETRRLLS